jgi:uncharacterized protein DUF6226
MGNRWGAAGPPDEAYSRVTDPQRYAPLRAIARDVLDDLRRRFDVTPHASSELDPNRTTRAPVTMLVPSDTKSSPLSVTFTAFPGLVVRFGHTHREPIPECGCDACDETVEECEELLRDLVAAVVTGSFGEGIINDSDGWWRQTWRSTDAGSRSGRTRITAEQARALNVKLGSDDARWEPWPPRLHTSN